MSRRRLVLWVPLIGFLAFAIFFAIGLRQPSERPVRSALIGQSVPDFALAGALPGRPGLSSAEMRQGGQPRIVNIFASWCAPCKIEAPQLEALRRRGIPIDGIAVRDRPEDLARFLVEFGDPFRAIGADVDRRVQLNLGSGGVPETFIVDGRGIIRYQHIGAINPADVPRLVEEYQRAGQ